MNTSFPSAGRSSSISAKSQDGTGRVAIYARVSSDQQAQQQTIESQLSALRERVCDNKQVRTDKLDEAVWNDVCELLRNPGLLREECQRRLDSAEAPSAERTSRIKQVEHSRRAVNRLMDAYSDGVISRAEFDPRIERARRQLAQREAALKQSQVENAQRNALHESLECLASFSTQIAAGLESADWTTRREILRTAVDHVQVDRENIRITYRINVPPFSQPRGE